MSDQFLEKSLKFLMLLLALILLTILVIPFTAEAQTHIHRSIQNNTSAIATSGGTITFTITGDTIATFSADMPDSVGRGCAIEYDSTGSVSVKAIAFIKYRTSKRVFGIQRFNGSKPAPASATTTWNIFHAYTTWRNLHNGDENDGINNTVENFDAHTDGVNIDARSEYWNVAMYAGNHDMTSSDGGDDMNTSPTEMLNIYAPCGTKFVGTSQRHSGKLTYRGPVWTVTTGEAWRSADDAGNRTCQDVIFDGIQWDFTDVDATVALRIHASETGLVQNFTIRNCIFRGSDSTATSAVEHAAIVWDSGTASNGGMVRIYNNLFYGWKSAATTTNEGAILFTSVNIADSMMVHSNTIDRCQDGIKRSNAGNILSIKNNITTRCNDGVNGGIAGDKHVSDISSDCTSCTNNILGTPSYTDRPNGDFSLQSGDTVAKDAGTRAAVGSVTAPTRDLKGYTRPVSTNDVGAFEQGATASGCSTEVDATATDSPVLKRRRNPVQ